MRELRPIAVPIAAPRVFVFQCLTSYGVASPIWVPGLEPELLQQDGRVLVVRFRTRLLGRVVMSTQRVRLFPPERIQFERVEGPLADLHTEIALSAAEVGTELRFRGDITAAGALLSGVVERAVAGPLINRRMRRALDRYRMTIEAASRASGRSDEPVDPATGTEPTRGRRARR